MFTMVDDEQSRHAKVIQERNISGSQRMFYPRSRKVVADG